MSAILSHYRAGSGAVLIETREERRFLAELLSLLPDASVCTLAAPSGACKDARTGRTDGSPAARPGRGREDDRGWLPVGR